MVTRDVNDHLASELAALAPAWAARTPSELAGAARSLASAWELGAPSVIAAACACEDLDEASPLAADHWLVGDYLVRRFLARFAAGHARARRAPSDARVRVHGLSRVERTFWNLSSAVVERSPDRPSPPVSRDEGSTEGALGAALVAGLGGSPWPAVLDALHFALVRGLPVSLLLDARYARLADPLGELFAGAGAGAVRVSALAPGGDLGAEARSFCAAHVVGSRAALDALEGIEARTAALRTMLPVVIVPTLYDGDELAFVARQVVGLATAGRHYGTEGVVALVVSGGWAQRERFAALVAAALDEVGTASRHRVAFHREVSAADPERSISVEEHAVVEVPLRSEGVTPYLREAVELCNDRLAGGLAVTVVAHPLHVEDRDLGGEIDRQLASLAYGMVGLNVWPSAFRALSDAPFGCRAADGRAETRGGLGFTQNAAGIAAPGRVLARAPLKPLIAPAFIAKRSRLAAARELCVHQGAPSLGRAASIAWRALWPG